MFAVSKVITADQNYREHLRGTITRESGRDMPGAGQGPSSSGSDLNWHSLSPGKPQNVLLRSWQHSLTWQGAAPEPPRSPPGKSCGG